MKQPLLSIIVPIYKVEEFLEECVNSILNQEFSDFELILVNDGSPDNCGKICDEFAKKDQRIKVIHKVNGGLSSARNAGIEIAKGSYLSFIDSDDFISEDFYKDNMNFLISNKDVDMLIAQVCYYDGNKNKVVENFPRKIDVKKEILSYMLSIDYIGSAWINIYKKEIFDKLRYPEGSIYEDGYILTDIIEKIEKIYISNRGIYYYRNREGSIMTKKKSLENWRDIFSTHTKQLNFCYKIEDNKKIFINKYVACHLAPIYASLEYPDTNFKEIIQKFENYKFNFSQLWKSEIPKKTAIKLYLLRLLGYQKIIELYKFLNRY